MIDLETMGTGSNSAIVQLGAVQFDRHNGIIGKLPFKANIDLQSCLDMGLLVTGSTIEFWMTKSDTQRNGLYNPKPEHLNKVLTDFNNWLDYKAALENRFASAKIFHLWGRSPRFDLGLLHDAYKKAQLPVLWDFRKEMDVRTIEALRPDVKTKFDDERDLSKSHDSIADCEHQINYVSAIWQELQPIIYEAPNSLI